MKKGLQKPETLLQITVLMKQEKGVGKCVLNRNIFRNSSFIIAYLERNNVIFLLLSILSDS